MVPPNILGEEIPSCSIFATAEQSKGWEVPYFGDTGAKAVDDTITGALIERMGS